MLFQEKPLSSYNWDTIFSFRAYMQEYHESINHIHEAKTYTNFCQNDDLSLSENSGYNYIPFRNMYDDEAYGIIGNVRTPGFADIAIFVQ
jgi:hypothetical protein